MAWRLQGPKRTLATGTITNLGTGSKTVQTTLPVCATPPAAPSSAAR